MRRAVYATTRPLLNSQNDAKLTSFLFVDGTRWITLTLKSYFMDAILVVISLKKVAWNSWKFRKPRKLSNAGLLLDHFCSAIFRIIICCAPTMDIGTLYDVVIIIHMFVNFVLVIIILIVSNIMIIIAIIIVTVSHIYIVVVIIIVLSIIIGSSSSFDYSVLLSRMRLTYLVLRVQCGCNTVLVYLPKLAVPDQDSRLLLSILIEGRWLSGRRCMIASWYITLRQVTASAEGIGVINRRPSSLRLCDVQGHHYCKSPFQL